MPTALLHRIARQSLPRVLLEPEDFEPAAALVHAGHIRAWMQLVPCEWGGLPRTAIVVAEITPAGWELALLARHQSHV